MQLVVGGWILISAYPQRRRQSSSSGTIQGWWSWGEVQVDAIGRRVLGATRVEEHNGVLGAVVAEGQGDRRLANVAGWCAGARQTLEGGEARIAEEQVVDVFR